MPDQSEGRKTAAAKALNPVEWRKGFKEVIAAARPARRRMQSRLVVAMAVAAWIGALFVVLI